MAIRAKRVIAETTPKVLEQTDVPRDGGRPAIAKIVVPRARRPESNKVGAPNEVRELQAAIERAFVLLDEAADRDDDPEVTALPFRDRRSSTAVIGAAAGSEIRYRRSFSSLLLKTVSGLAIVFLVGLVPLQKALTPVSSEAFVNAPLYLVYAPATGVVTSIERDVGAAISADQPVAVIQAQGGSSIPVVSAGGGKVWEMRVAPGEMVTAGDVIARVVGCSASSVIASVSEGVYDKLSPGTLARFNFFGSNRFYLGTVANLLGHTEGAGNLAISPVTFTRGAYRVVVAMPTLAIDNCAVGRRGSVVFNPPTR